MKYYIATFTLVGDPSSSFASNASKIASKHLSRIGVRHLPTGNHDNYLEEIPVAFYVMTDMDPVTLKSRFGEVEQEDASRNDRDVQIDMNPMEELKPEFTVRKINRFNPDKRKISSLQEYFSVYVSAEIPDYLLKQLHEGRCPVCGLAQPEM